MEPAIDVNEYNKVLDCKFFFLATIDWWAINKERDKLRNGLVLMAQTGKEHCKKLLSSFLVGNGDMCQDCTKYSLLLTYEEVLT